MYSLCISGIKQPFDINISKYAHLINVIVYIVCYNAIWVIVLNIKESPDRIKKCVTI